MRYLHQCIADLKAARVKDSPYFAPQYQPLDFSQPSEAVTPSEEPSDEEMEDEPADQEPVRFAPIRQATSHPGQHTPQMMASTYGNHQSSNTTPQHWSSPNHPPRSAYDPHRSYPISPFTTASMSANSNHPSPMLLPQPQGMEDTSELDHEASAALLMLNSGDRRSTGSKLAEQMSGLTRRPETETRGMSVKDLLS